MPPSLPPQLWKTSTNNAEEQDPLQSDQKGECCEGDSCNLCKIPEDARSRVFSPSSNGLLLLDTNVVLHQIDLLENPAIIDVIVLQTVLEEVKHQSVPIYKRIREVIASDRNFYVFNNELCSQTQVDRPASETVNDRNDRATKWYQNHLASKSISVTLLTNDRGNMEKALNEGLKAKTMDILVDPGVDHTDAEDKKMGVGFREHWSITSIHDGLRDGKLHQGVFRMARGSIEAHIAREDILIQGWDSINRAVEMDVVAVELLPKAEWVSPSRFIISEDDDPDDTESDEGLHLAGKKPTGRVVGIIKRNWKPYHYIVEAPNSAHATSLLFVPSDKKIPRIRIKSRQVASLVNKRIVVCIDGWDKNSRHPHGHYVRELGNVGDKQAEAEVILLQYDIPFHPFSKAVLKCLPVPPWIAAEDADCKNRRDLRHLPIVSVDPPGCVDIDDALHIRQLNDDLFEVDIADVTHFVRDGTAIDEEAASRGTTVYLVDRRIDMLPKELSEDICSLRSEVDRFAFSVIWRLNSEGAILHTDYTKSVIRSVASLSYEQAQNKIDDKTQQDEIAKGLRILNSIAKKIRKARVERGALELASTEIKFKIEQQTKDPTGIEQYQLRETNSMVEEFMLLANVSVAEKIYQHFPNCALLRRHPSPLPGAFDDLINVISQKGFTLNVETSKDLATSLDAAQDPTNPFFNKLLRMLSTRCMSQAVYFSTGGHATEFFHHYGLAAPIYTHFTSPIRRYADVVVHRLLAACIGVSTVSQDFDNRKVNRLCENINFRHRSAQYAERGSVELHTLLYFKGRTTTEEGYITRVRANGFMVLVPKYGIEGPVFVCAQNAPNPYTFDEKMNTLSLDSLKLAIFDKVVVQISIDESQSHSYKLKLVCISPPIPSVEAVGAIAKYSNAKRAQTPTKLSGGNSQTKGSEPVNKKQKTNGVAKRSTNK